MNPVELIKLRSLMDISSGSREIRIGIIDGPIDFTHEAFQGSRIRAIRESQLSACKSASSIACVHGTFVVGILGAQRGLSAPSICPGCEIILRPVFTEAPKVKKASNTVIYPISTPEELSNAIVETIDAGCKIINLSLGLSASSLIIYRELQEAYDYALHKGVIIVIAAGNQGNIGSISLARHTWPIPVAACSKRGIFDPISNFGSSIGTRGLMAPGQDISSTAPGGQYIQMSGTSAAAPFVTGTIALLWSIFPTARAADIRYAILRGSDSDHNRPRNIIPPLINAEQALKTLRSI